MKFWLVSRETHEEALRSKQNEIDELRGTLYRLEDQIYLQKFGFQLHGTIVDAPTQAEEPTPELTPVEQAAADRAEEKRRDSERLTSISRTRPSQLGSALAGVHAREMQRRAEAARPNHMATQVFAQAKEEALKS